jgi:NADH-quinone oxidoreductase subunit M
MMVCVVPGVVLAAAYMLRMLQKVAYGGTNNPDHSQLRDLGLREIVTLAPLLVFVFWIGLHPEPFTRVMHASVANVLRQAGSPVRSELPGPNDGGGKKLAIVPLAAHRSLPETKR